MGESKYDVYQIIPKDLQPTTILVKPFEAVQHTIHKIDKAKLKYPFIVKPDIGERGWGVQKIENQEQFIEYHCKINQDFLVQEFISYPIELGVFYFRYPGKQNGVISSIVEKGFLTVKGNGENTLEELIEHNPRAILQKDILQQRWSNQWTRVIPNGEEIVLEEIGNHCRGTMFLNGAKYSSAKLSRQFDQIADRINGFYFGRFDIRCKSVADLEEGLNFSILELNGAGGEPGHIYQPGTGLMAAYRSIFYHLKVLFEISRSNHKRGHRHVSFKEGYHLWLKAVKQNQIKKNCRL
jgi:hypothetical protein